MANCQLRRGLELPKAAGIERGAVFGNLDGFHLGHQSLLEQLRSWKHASGEREASVVSLYPHPLKILQKQPIPQLSSIRQDMDILGSFDIDTYQFLRFSKEFAKRTAQDFVETILLKGLQIDYLIIGADARVGRDKQGDATFIADLFEKHGKRVQVADYQRTSDGEKVGSRLIRDLVTQGAVDAIPTLLGRFFTVEGRVVHGDKRGKTLGFPTANSVSKNFVQPANGVYCTLAHLNGRQYTAVTNVGKRPTFSGSKRQVESFLLDYTGSDFYGERIAIAFLKRIRDEFCFESVDELKEQISIDIDQARMFFSNFPGTT